MRTIVESTQFNVQLSIRWKILLPFVLIILIIIAFLPISISIVNNILEDQADNRLQQIGESIAQFIEQNEESALLSANFVANLADLEELEQNPDFETLNSVLQARKDELALQELSYYLPTFQPGDPAYYYGGPPVTRRFQVSEDTNRIRDELILRTLETGEPQNRVAIAPQSSQIIGAAPVIDEMGQGSIIGIVLAVFYIDDSYVESISGIFNADVALVKNNAIIASTISSETGYQTMLQDGSFSGAVSSVTIKDSSMEEGSDQRLLAMPLILDGERQGQILVGQSVEEIFQVSDRIRDLIIAAAVLVGSLTLIVAAATAINFARPLKELADVSNQIQGGDLSQRVPVTHIVLRDELTELGENFNSMAARLEDLMKTLEKRVQERTAELIEERNKLRVAMNELAIARDEALAANRSKSVFLANMSHELRTPLNAIIGYTDLVLSGVYGEVTETQHNRLQRVIENGHHLLSLINDVLDLSKIEAGRMEIYTETFAVQDVVNTVLETANPLAYKNNNDLLLEAPDDMGHMKSDKTKVQQILNNLLSNAAKFTENGKITLKVERDNASWLHFSVQDTGIGMTEEQMEKVFNEFTQADASTTRRFGGTGLGLAITSRYCQLLGGTIDVHSTPGEGTTFVVLLPPELHMLEETAPVDTTPQAQRGQATDSSEKPILVVDDDETVQDLMSEYLSQAGYSVVTAHSGEEGLKIAREIDPCLITLDVMMPEMDGWNVLAQLKSDDTLNNIPVIMLTMIDNKNMGFALGASDYLMKPIQADKLRDVINKYHCNNKPCTILLIEDNESTRELMYHILDNEGWHVVQAENGRDALEKLEAGFVPELILLDLMMPEMDGFSFLDVIRKREQYQHTPVIVVTAMTLSPRDRKILDGNVQRILQKGAYDREALLGELVEQIKNTLE